METNTWNETQIDRIPNAYKSKRLELPSDKVEKQPHKIHPLIKRNKNVENRCPPTKIDLFKL